MPVQRALSNLPPRHCRTLPVLYNPTKVGFELRKTKVKLRQPSQQEGTKNAHSPQFKHIGSGSWAGSRKTPVESIRPLPDYTVDYAAAR